MFNNLDIRLKIQQRIYVEISRLLHKIDYNVVKMYWKSKKNVYGIENELHLVENVQKLLTESVTNLDLRVGEKITHEMI
jgi:hypothetical protein